MGKNSCAKRCFGCVWACWVLMLVLFVPRKNSKVIWVRPLSVLMGQQLPFPSRSQGPSTNSFYTPTGKNVNESNNKPLYLTKPFVDLSVWSQLIRETTFFFVLFCLFVCVFVARLWWKGCCCFVKLVCVVWLPIWQWVQDHQRVTRALFLYIIDDSFVADDELAHFTERPSYPPKWIATPSFCLVFDQFRLKAIRQFQIRFFESIY